MAHRLSFSPTASTLLPFSFPPQFYEQPRTRASQPHRVDSGASFVPREPSLLPSPFPAFWLLSVLVHDFVYVCKRGRRLVCFRRQTFRFLSRKILKQNEKANRLRRKTKERTHDKVQHQQVHEHCAIMVYFTFSFTSCFSKSLFGLSSTIRRKPVEFNYRFSTCSHQNS